MASSGEDNNQNKSICVDVEAKTVLEDDEEDFAAVARRGGGGGVNGDREDRLSPKTDSMASVKELESYAMSEDVYAFVIVADPCSVEFVFALTVICIKYVVFGALMFDIARTGVQGIPGAPRPTLVVKALLVPVAIAMQSDLMAVFATVANVRYDEHAKEVSKHATKTKYILAQFLQLIDGGASLAVNYGVMLQTDTTLGVLLNFAALHFLQDIDDIFYVLVEKGFFGDAMEEMTATCKQISWPRRADKSRVSKIIVNLDTILFFLTFIILFTTFLVVTILCETNHVWFDVVP